ncbi:hypothetical protein [Stenotrophomonas acidaminiphila]|uniref:hypothetical protein n=1 Tax=Stenotrophomonas acidaminiphila TaxID=128780 RepID=UPI0020C67E6A|nr:hypothetical protein [Stenotrophomonas acidaminiphila]
MIGAVSLLIGLCILLAVQQLVRTGRTLGERMRRSDQQAANFGLPTVAAPQQPQAVRKRGAEVTGG